MGKSPKAKCKHGLSPVYMQGCPHCVTTAMKAMHICIDNDITADELWAIMVAAFPTKEVWDAAVVAAKEKVAVACRQAEGGA